MAIYIRLVGSELERVYSPDSATEFPKETADSIRVRAYQKWHNSDWQLERLPLDKYRVKANT